MVEKLFENFSATRRNQLREELLTCATLEEVGRAIRDEISYYTDVEGGYLHSLSGPQARTAIALLALLRESATAVSKTVQLPPKRETRRGGKQTTTNNSLRDTAIITVSAGIGAWALSWTGMIGGIIGASAAAAAASFITSKLQSPAPEGKAPESTGQENISLNVDQLINHLAALFTRVDELVLAPAPQAQATAPATNSSRLDEFGDVLQFLQKISGDRFQDLPDQLDFLLHEEMPSILAGNGITLHEPAPEMLTPEGVLSAKTLQLYQVEPSKSVSSPTLDEKAILVDGRVKMKGKIRIPR